ncbi:MAG TPA: hypothetical protein DCX06_10905 [Opitutae bacterium]|nr:hypothetical protein [Opitutae bacterium]
MILQTGRNQLAFRLGDWKLVSTEKTTWYGKLAMIDSESLQLYHLNEDPEEEVDLSDQCPERVNALLNQITAGRIR